MKGQVGHMALIGADPQALRATACFLKARAGDVSNARLVIGGRLGTTGWRGVNSSQFRQRWNRELAPQLRSVHDYLIAMADEMQRQASEQERASTTGINAVRDGLRKVAPIVGVGPWWSRLSHRDLVDLLEIHEMGDTLMRLLTEVDPTTWRVIGQSNQYWKGIPWLSIGISGVTIWSDVNTYGKGDARTWESIFTGVMGVATSGNPLLGGAFIVSHHGTKWVLESTPIGDRISDSVFNRMSAGYDLDDWEDATRLVKDSRNFLFLGKHLVMTPVEATRDTVRSGTRWVGSKARSIWDWAL